jgi:hypothetical protein
VPRRPWQQSRAGAPEIACQRREASHRRHRQAQVWPVDRASRAAQRSSPASPRQPPSPVRGPARPRAPGVMDGQRAYWASPSCARTARRSVLSHIALRMGQEPGLPARLDMVKTGPVRDGRLARPQRIYIIGGGGSGKTTLGRQVARALGLGLTRGRAQHVHS